MKLAMIPVTQFKQNCTVIWDEATGRGTMVDPGGEVDTLVAETRRLGVTLDSILLTHGHIDHAGGAAELRERSGAIPIIGPDERDRFLLEGLAAQGAVFKLPSRDVLPDRWLTEGDTVDIAGAPFEVLHCPGHTPGSVVFVSRGLRFAIVGDVLFRGSIGRSDFGYGDEATLIAAITTKLLPLGDDVQFVCGHGPPSTIGQERRDNPYLVG